MQVVVTTGQSAGYDVRGMEQGQRQVIFALNEHRTLLNAPLFRVDGRTQNLRDLATRIHTFLASIMGNVQPIGKFERSYFFSSNNYLCRWRITQKLSPDPPNSTVHTLCHVNALHVHSQNPFTLFSQPIPRYKRLLDLDSQHLSFMLGQFTVEKYLARAPTALSYLYNGSRQETLLY